MSHRRPIVTGVSLLQGKAVINFDDNHKAVFQAHTRDGQNYDYLEYFSLFHGERRVTHFTSRIGRRLERRFEDVASDYTREQVVAYWETAADNLREHGPSFRESKPDLKKIKQIVAQGHTDLVRIKNGSITFP